MNRTPAIGTSLLDPGRGRLTAERGHERRRAAPQREVSLRGELGVDADDDAAGDAEIRRERPSRGKLGTGGQAVLADQRPELPLDLEAERPVRLEVDCEKWSG